jgi:hypothetical protein
LPFDQLEGILGIEEVRACNKTSFLFTLLSEFGQKTTLFGVIAQVERQPSVSVELQLINRQQAACSTGMPGDERQLAIDSTGIRPPKIIAVAVNRMASLINAIERDIEPEPWKREIVRIAAELPCTLYRTA